MGRLVWHYIAAGCWWHTLMEAYPLGTIFSKIIIWGILSRFHPILVIWTHLEDLDAWKVAVHCLVCGAQVVLDRWSACSLRLTTSRVIPYVMSLRRPYWSSAHQLCISILVQSSSVGLQALCPSINEVSLMIGGAGLTVSLIFSSWNIYSLH
jgi:hypothetical protein